MEPIITCLFSTILVPCTMFPPSVVIKNHHSPRLLTRIHSGFLIAIYLVIFAISLITLIVSHQVSLFPLLFLFFSLLAIILAVLGFIGSSFQSPEQRFRYISLNISFIGTVLYVAFQLFLFFLAFSASTLTSSFLLSKQERALENAQSVSHYLGSEIKSFTKFYLKSYGFGVIALVQAILNTGLVVLLALVLEKQLAYFV